MINHEALSHGDKIVSGVSPFCVACWNLALIATQEHEDQTIINSWLKHIDAKSRKSDSHQRVLYWIQYYQSNKVTALSQASEVLEKMKVTDFLYKIIEKEVMIFRNETETLLLKK